MIDWIFDHLTETTIVVAIVLVGSLVGYGIHQEHKQIAQCKADGGQWVIVGHHFSTTYIKSGDILVPIENRVNEYDCTRK